MVDLACASMMCECVYIWQLYVAASKAWWELERDPRRAARGRSSLSLSLCRGAMQTQMQVAAAADVWSETVRCSSDDARAGDRCAAAERGSLDVEYCDDETQSGVCAGAGRAGNAINEWPSVNTGGRGGADRRHRLAGQGGWEKQLRCVNVCVSLSLSREREPPPWREGGGRPASQGCLRAPDC